MNRRGCGGWRVDSAEDKASMKWWSMVAMVRWCLFLRGERGVEMTVVEIVRGPVIVGDNEFVLELKCLNVKEDLRFFWVKIKIFWVICIKIKIN